MQKPSTVSVQGLLNNVQGLKENRFGGMLGAEWAMIAETLKMTKKL